MNAEIIAVGSELLLGQIHNTNAKYLSQELATIGINVYFHTVVGDNPDRLRKAVEVSMKRADLLIFTGGLGPTKDDLTKETIAELLGVEIEIDGKALKSIEEYFTRRNMVMTPNNRKQAQIFKGSDVLPNDNGMAPGMLLTIHGKTFMLLPGPPSEMEMMFSKYGREALLNLKDQKEEINSRVLRFFGIGEAALEHELEELIEKQSNPTIAPLASDGEVTLRLTAKHTSFAECEKLLNRLEKQILSKVGQYFYGYDGTTLIKEMGLLLKDKKMTLAVAESLTGGLFQEEVTSISGVSEWFKGGIVAYLPEIKEKVLKVQPQTIEKHGVVSEQCAKEMAENVRNLLGADVGISFTGVAGPASLEGNEPGTVYIGISIKDHSPRSYLYKLQGNREGVRIRSVKYGAWNLIKAITS